MHTTGSDGVLVPLASAPAVGLVTLVVLHALLLVGLIALVALDRVRVPRGGIWVAILLLVSVLGPLMVLLRGRGPGGGPDGTPAGR